MCNKIFSYTNDDIDEQLEDIKAESCCNTELHPQKGLSSCKGDIKDVFLNGDENCEEIGIDDLEATDIDLDDDGDWIIEFGDGRLSSTDNNKS